MKNFLRILTLLLIATIACSLFACNKGGDEEPTDEVVTDGFFEENRSYIALDADVKIFCTRDWSKEIVAYCEKIVSAVKEKTGLELEIVYKSEDAGKEIVVGYADNHKSSVEAYNSIAIDQYTVYVNDRSAVVAAFEYEKLEEAANEFVAHSIVKDGGEWKIASISPKGDGKNPSKALTAYRIVYAADADEHITGFIVPYVQRVIRERFKVTLEAVSDAEPASEHEIVIGNTNRSTAVVKNYYSADGEFEDYRYAIVPDGNKIFLVGKEAASMNIAVAKLMDRVIYSDYGPKLINLKERRNASASMSTEAPRELAEGADLRIMSYNVLNPVWGKTENANLNDVDSRIDKVIDLLLYYHPDVVGLQEASSPWHKALNRYFAELDSYEFLCNASNGSADNMTGFIYNSATVKVIDSYVIDLVEKSDHRVISVGVFETLKDGKQFVVMNTHPVPSSYENYSEQMAQIAELEAQEMEKYSDLPIFFTGDFNTTTLKPEYAAYVETLNVTNARESADVIFNHNASYAGFKKPGSCDGTKCIDHIFHNANADVKFFNTVVDDSMHLGSDHLPIYADVELIQS